VARRDAAANGGPDGPLIARLRAALDMWEATGRGPTSSVSGGGAVAELEAQLATVCGTKYALCVSSGTLALRVAAQAVGVHAGANVVVPALDWPAAAAAVRSLGAEPKPADCGPDSILVSAEAMRGAIDAQTRAVVVTHLAGMPADMDALLRVAAEREIPLIEDGSQAMGATFGGRPVGALGTVAAFSLGPGKLVDAGEAGVIVTNDESVYMAAVRATQHPARQLRNGFPPSPLPLATRLHPAAAFLGLAAVCALPGELHRRRALADMIRSRATGCGLLIPPEPAGQRFSWSCVPAIARTDVEANLSADELGSAPLGLMHIPSLVSRTGTTPNADTLLPLARRLYARSPMRDSAARLEVGLGAAHS
jgi:dTDP-4-amino-4,6-dideoxygalactose transaminase